MEFPNVQLDTKIIGLNINSYLTRQDPVDNIIRKASERLFMLPRAISLGVTQGQLVQLYCQRIRPVLEHAFQVWHPVLTTAYRTNLESVQIRVGRIMLGGPYYSYKATLSTFGLPTLDNWSCHFTNSFGHTLEENDCLHILLRWAPSRHQTRHGAEVPPVRRRTERYRKSSISPPGSAAQ